MSYIPDISNYHPVKSWSQVKDNCLFLISKATEGRTFVDKSLTDFVRGCEENHIHYWLYTFLRKGNEVEQVNFMLQTCKEIVGSYFVGYILDVESGNDGQAVYDALKHLEGCTEDKCMIYTMYSQYSIYQKAIEGRADKTAFWEAIYGSNNGTYQTNHPCHDNAELHQFTSKGSCDGIGSPIDLNRITGAGKTLEWFTNSENARPIQQTTAVTVEVPSYVKGQTYTTLAEMKVRKTPSLSGALVGYAGLSANAKKHDTNRNGCIDAGTRVTCQGQVVDNAGNVWVKIPSGYICGYLIGKDKVYVK